MQDTITREITVKANVQKVYDAITNPEQITKWFPDGVEGSLEVGQQSLFNFDGHGKSSVLVVAAEPYTYFAYRWIPGGAHMVSDLNVVQTTLVEFFIEDFDSETKITLKESGFTSLPSDIIEKSFSQNSSGWDFMLSRLEKFMSQG